MSHNKHKYPKEMKETGVYRLLEGSEGATGIQRETVIGINILYRWRD